MLCGALPWALGLVRTHVKPLSPARHVIIHLLQEGSDERREAYLRLGLIGCNLKRAGVAEESGQLHSRLDRMHRVLTMRKDEDW